MSRCSRTSRKSRSGLLCPPNGPEPFLADVDIPESGSTGARSYTLRPSRSSNELRVPVSKQLTSPCADNMTASPSALSLEPENNELVDWAEAWREAFESQPRLVPRTPPRSTSPPHEIARVPHLARTPDILRLAGWDTPRILAACGPLPEQDPVSPIRTDNDSNSNSSDDCECNPANTRNSSDSRTAGASSDDESDSASINAMEHNSPMSPNAAQCDRSKRSGTEMGGSSSVLGKRASVPEDDSSDDSERMVRRRRLTKRV